MNTANHFKDKQKTQNQTQLSQEDFDFLRACVVMFKSAKKSVNYLFWYSIIRAYSLYIQEKNGQDTSALDLCFDHIQYFQETEELPNDDVCVDHLTYYEKILVGLKNPRVMHYLKLICESTSVDETNAQALDLGKNPS